MISCKLGKGQDYLYLTKEYPFITTHYIVSNKIKEIKIFSPDSLLLGYEKYNKYGLVIENCIFENTIITDKNEFYYYKNQLLNSVKSFYSNYRSGFQSFTNFTYKYDEDKKLKFILEVNQSISTAADTISKFFYNKSGQKTKEIYNYTMERKFTYENGLIKNVTYDTRPELYISDEYLKTTNYYYQDKKLIKREIIEEGVSYEPRKSTFSYYYDENKMIGYDEFIYYYKNDLVNKIKNKNSPDSNGDDVEYSYYK